MYVKGNPIMYKDPTGHFVAALTRMGSSILRAAGQALRAIGGAIGIVKMSEGSKTDKKLAKKEKAGETGANPTVSAEEVESQERIDEVLEGSKPGRKTGGKTKIQREKEGRY